MAGVEDKANVKQFPADWVEVRRGFGEVDILKDLRSGEFLTASGLHDGGYIIWRKTASMRRIGVSELRKLNATKLRQLDEPLEICHNNQPLRVLIPFQQYMVLQDEYRKLPKQIEVPHA